MSSNANPKDAKSTVRNCYRILLGREPENEHVVDGKTSIVNAPQSLLREFMFSPEFSSQDAGIQRRQTQLTDNDRTWAKGFLFNDVDKLDAKWENAEELVDDLRRSLDNKKFVISGLDSHEKICILGNCQTDVLTELFHCIGYENTRNFREHTLLDKEKHNEILEIVRSSNLIITQPLYSVKYGELMTSRLKSDDEICKKLLVIPNLYFSGLHPEIVYVGAVGDRYVSPIGDYHSGIVIASFRNGLSTAKTISLFQSVSFFKKTGLLDEWKKSLNEFAVRELFCDIKLSEFIESNIKEIPLFYSSNHPSLQLTTTLFKRILWRINMNEPRIPLIRDVLQNNIIYPIWKPVIEAAGLNYVSLEKFNLASSDNVLMNIEDFVLKSFEMYSQRSPDDVQEHEKVNRLTDAILNSNHL